MTDFNEQLAELKRGTQEMLTERELVEKLKRGKPLHIKQGSIPPPRICISGTPCCSIKCGNSRSPGTTSRS